IVIRQCERLRNDDAIIAILMKGMASSLPVGAPPRCEWIYPGNPASRSPASPKFAPGAGAPTATSQDLAQAVVGSPRSTRCRYRSATGPPRCQRNAQHVLSAKQAKPP